MLTPNKYQKIYDEIVNRAVHQNRDRASGVFYEQHHILPHALGGTDEKKNLVLLTPREHFLCHLLLTKFTTGSDRSKMAMAFWIMSGKRRSNSTRFTSKLYQNVRELYLKQVSENSLRTWADPKYRERMIQQRTGRKNTASTKQRMSEAAKLRHIEKPLSAEARTAISKRHSGKTLSNETIEKIRAGSVGIKKPGTSEKLTGYKQEIVCCPHCFREGGINVMRKYHFSKCKVIPFLVNVAELKTAGQWEKILKMRYVSARSKKTDETISVRDYLNLK